jgi:high-affinity Fe2+/Pb2+ permease
MKDDNDDKNSFFLQNTIILYVIGAVAAIARIVIRWCLTRQLGKEELIMFFGLLCWTGDTMLIIVTVSKGTNQIPKEQREHFPAEEARERIIGSKSFISAWFLYVTAIWACKAAILMFYKRLTGRVANPRMNQYACITLVVTYITCMLSLCLVCRPFAGNWTIYPDPGRKYFCKTLRSAQERY